MHNNAAGEAIKKRLVFGRLIVVSMCNISSRISHGCYRRMERQTVMLETHMHIDQLCHRLTAAWESNPGLQVLTSLAVKNVTTTPPESHL